jgi:hypothetical protein
MNLFFYTRTVEDKTFKDSFNVNKVIRTVQNEDGSALVLLDDLHERAHEIPDMHPKTRAIIGTKRVKDVFQSEITLSKEDYARLSNLTNIQ